MTDTIHNTILPMTETTAEPEDYTGNYGLLLWGNVGTGKSYFAGCIANALMEQEVPVCMTNFAASPCS